MTTDEFIAQLSQGVTPVRRVVRPPRLALYWLVVAGLVLTGTIILRGTRADLLLRLQDTAFVLSLSAAVATAILAGVAAMITSMPDRSRMWGLLAVPPAIVWLSTIGEGCLFQWRTLNASAWPDDEPFGCILTLLAVAVPLSAALVWMLRHAAVLRTAEVAANAGLAVSAGSAAVLAAVHLFDASLMILLWSFGVLGMLLPAHLLGFAHLRRRQPLRMAQPNR